MASNDQPRPTNQPLTLGVVAGIGIIAVLLIAVSVVAGQAWVLRGQASTRQEQESGPMTYLASAPTPVLNYSASRDARQSLIERNGVTPWPTTQPTAPPTATTMVSAIPGLNRAKVKAGNSAFTRLGCVTCHTTDGRAGVGPSLYNIFGSQIDIADGPSLKADADYIRESIRQPKAKVHKGYQPVMPDFGPQIKDREIETITEFLKSISPDPAHRVDAGPIASPK
jgi:mono/diheme cytochrome c family protein